MQSCARRSGLGLIALAAAVTLAAATFGAMAAAPQGAGAESSSARTVGTTGIGARPSCPTPRGADPAGPRGCRVLSRVTAFQVHARGQRLPHRVPRTGVLVAWGIDLARPSRDERRSFTEGFEFGAPSARLAVLAPGRNQRMKLARQTPRVELNPHLGSRAIFTLEEPFKVQRGRILGLTTQSWAPNLAHGRLGPRQNRWRASRNPRTADRCSERDFLINESRPQVRTGSVERYACLYAGEGVLFWGYIVPVDR